MGTKTIKTPLTTAETCGLSCWPSSLAPESKLSHNLEFHPDLVPRLSHHRGKNIALRAEKPLRKSLCGIHKNVFLVFSSGDVFSCKATGDNGRASAGARSQVQSHDIGTKAQSAKTSSEGFSRFFVNK